MKRGKAQGQRGSAWAFMERFEIPFFDKPMENYLTRWRLIQTPWLSLYLHRFDHPDSRPTLHDHPWTFLSIVLRGGYIERRLNPNTLEVDEAHHVRWINRVRASDAHAILSLDRTPTWSLMLVGPRVRKWGYWERFSDGSWRWTEFDKHLHGLEFDEAMARRGTA